MLSDVWTSRAHLWFAHQHFGRPFSHQLTFPVVLITISTSTPPRHRGPIGPIGPLKLARTTREQLDPCPLVLCCHPPGESPSGATADSPPEVPGQSSPHFDGFGSKATAFLELSNSTPRPAVRSSTAPACRPGGTARPLRLAHGPCEVGHVG